VELPHNWSPRDYQLEAWRYMARGGKRLVACCHRRWGKDDISLHLAACKAHERAATYWHMLPQQNQARRAIWQAVNPHSGLRRLDEAFPEEIRASTNDSEMYIQFHNGSMWHVVGSDNYDRLVGSPPAGIVFSEWSLADPTAWARLEPILMENDGWASFIYTSRGKNHGASLFEMAERREGWKAIRQSALDTDVFTREQLAEIEEGLVELYGEEEGRSLFNMEYMSSFDSAVAGAYYSSQLNRAEKEGRIAYVPADPDLPVSTIWDLGIRDAMAVIFIQELGREVRLVDYEEHTGKGMPQMLKIIQDKPYVYKEHWAPHDIKVRELGTGKSRLESAAALGFHFQEVQNIPVIDGINAARAVFPRIWIDKGKCERLVDALYNYRKEFDEKMMTYKDKPVHDWSCHGADAFRYLAVVQDQWMDEGRGMPKVETSLGPAYYL
jgi:phage terminase large subunit